MTTSILILSYVVAITVTELDLVSALEHGIIPDNERESFMLIY